MASQPIILKLDASELLDSLPSRVDADMLRDASPELLKGFFDALQFPEKLCRIECDGLPASGARELIVRLKPSDFLRSFVAALRTGNGQIGMIGNATHNLPSR